MIALTGRSISETVVLNPQPFMPLRQHFHGVAAKMHKIHDPCSRELLHIRWISRHNHRSFAPQFPSDPCRNPATSVGYSASELQSTIRSPSASAISSAYLNRLMAISNPAQAKKFAAKPDRATRIFTSPISASRTCGVFPPAAAYRSIRRRSSS